MLAWVEVVYFLAWLPLRLYFSDILVKQGSFREKQNPVPLLWLKLRQPIKLPHKTRTSGGAIGVVRWGATR